MMAYEKCIFGDKDSVLEPVAGLAL